MRARTRRASRWRELTPNPSLNPNPNPKPNPNPIPNPNPKPNPNPNPNPHPYSNPNPNLTRTQAGSANTGQVVLNIFLACGALSLTGWLANPNPHPNPNPSPNPNPNPSPDPIQAALREVALDPHRARVPPATLLAVCDEVQEARVRVRVRVTQG